MDKEKLILESLSWIITNTNPNVKGQLSEKEELLGRINDELNPEEQTIAEKTKDALRETTEKDKKDGK